MKHLYYYHTLLPSPSVLTRCRFNKIKFRTSLSSSSPFAPSPESSSNRLTRGFAASTNDVAIVNTPLLTAHNSNIKWHHGAIAREDREKRMQQRGGVMWFTGLSGSGKSTLAFALEEMLHRMNKISVVLDGDNMRQGLNSDLGFCYQDRKENLRRLGEVSKLLVQNGVIVLVSLVSPYRSERDAVRAILDYGDFHEIYMNTPLEVCEERDPKGMYRMARNGVIKNFTGIDGVYEKPVRPELTIDCVDENGIVFPPKKHVIDIIAYMHTVKMLNKTT